MNKIKIKIANEVIKICSEQYAISEEEEMIIKIKIIELSDVLIKKVK